MSIKLPANEAKEIISINKEHDAFQKLPKLAQKLVGHINGHDLKSPWELVEDKPEYRIFKKRMPSEKVILTNISIFFQILIISLGWNDFNGFI